MTPPSPAGNKITDVGARALAAGIRANKKNGGKLTTLDFEDNPMTEAGMTAMAEAFHEAEMETNRYTPTAVKDALAELRARDNDQTAALFKVLAEIGEELGKTEFKSRVTELKKQMCARASLSARARGDVTRVVPAPAASSPWKRARTLRSSTRSSRRSRASTTRSSAA